MPEFYACCKKQRSSRNIITHVDFARLAYTRKTATCYSSFSALRSLLLDFRASR